MLQQGTSDVLFHERGFSKLEASKMDLGGGGGVVGGGVSCHEK